MPGWRVTASGRVFREIRGQVFGKREVSLQALKTLPGDAPARPEYPAFRVLAATGPGRAGEHARDCRIPRRYRHVMYARAASLTP